MTLNSHQQNRNFQSPSIEERGWGRGADIRVPVLRVEGKEYATEIARIKRRQGCRLQGKDDAESENESLHEQNLGK